ncbi:hypothetical protein THAOC_12161, partial [Thalassiosira oceanica]
AGLARRAVLLSAPAGLVRIERLSWTDALCTGQLDLCAFDLTAEGGGRQKI